MLSPMEHSTYAIIDISRCIDECRSGKSRRENVRSVTVVPGTSQIELIKTWARYILFLEDLV